MYNFYMGINECLRRMTDAWSAKHKTRVLAFINGYLTILTSTPEWGCLCPNPMTRYSNLALVAALYINAEPWQTETVNKWIRIFWVLQGEENNTK